MKKIWIWGISLFVMISIVSAGVLMLIERKASVADQQQYVDVVTRDTPTLFLHGFGGSVNSEKFLVKQAQQQKVTQDVITAIVDKEGDVTFKGKWSKKAMNPIVQIELENNKMSDPNRNAEWIKNVLVALQQQYHIKDFNFVGHSMANMSFAHYMMIYEDDASLPQLRRQVNIAATFNGVLNMNEKVNEITVDEQGKPSRMNPPYPSLLVLKDIYKGRNIHVLNIYGDLKDGTHSDGSVSNSSSRSLKYLLGDSPKSYKESKYEGKMAQHSALHENTKVANELIAFLWGK